jgi:hypothetical protein
MSDSRSAYSSAARRSRTRDLTRSTRSARAADTTLATSTTRPTARDGRVAPLGWSGISPVAAGSAVDGRPTAEAGVAAGAGEAARLLVAIDLGAPQVVHDVVSVLTPSHTAQRQTSVMAASMRVGRRACRRVGALSR